MSARRIFSRPTPTDLSAAKAAPQSGMDTQSLTTQAAVKTPAPQAEAAAVSPVKAPAPNEVVSALSQMPTVRAPKTPGAMVSSSASAPSVKQPDAILWSPAQAIDLGASLGHDAPSGTSPSDASPSTTGGQTSPSPSSILQPPLNALRALSADSQDSTTAWQGLNARIQALPEPFRTQLAADLNAGLANHPILPLQSQIGLLLRDGEDAALVTSQALEYVDNRGRLTPDLEHFSLSTQMSAAEGYLAVVEASVPGAGLGSGPSGGSTGGSTGGLVGGSTGLSGVSDTAALSTVQVKAARSTDVKAAPAPASLSGSLGGPKSNPPASPPGGFDALAFDDLRDEVQGIRDLVDEIRLDITRARQAAINFINDLTGLNLEVGALSGNGPSGTGNLSGALSDLQQLMVIAQNILAAANAAQTAVDNLQAQIDLLQTLFDELDAIQNSNDPAPIKLAQMVAKIGEIRQAFDDLKGMVQTAVASVSALVTAVRDGITQAVALVTHLLQEIRAALEAFHTWLHNKVDAFEQFLADLRRRIDELTTYSNHKLSMKLKYIRCQDKQDPWSQDTGTGDKIHAAWIAIDPAGNVNHGIHWMGRFHHQEGAGASDAQVFRTPDLLLRRFDLDSWGTFNNTYVVYVALFEQDGNVEFDTKWATVASTVATDLRTRLSTLLNAEARGDVIDAYKDQLHQLIVNSFWNWNGDDLLGVMRYSVRHLYPAQAFTATPRSQLDAFFNQMATALPPGFWTYNHTNKTDAQLRQKMADMRLSVTTPTQDYIAQVFTNRDIPHDPTVGEGEYAVQVCWELHN